MYRTASDEYTLSAGDDEEKFISIYAKIIRQISVVFDGNTERACESHILIEKDGSTSDLDDPYWIKSLKHQELNATSYSDLQEYISDGGDQYFGQTYVMDWECNSDINFKAINGDDNNQTVIHYQIIYEGEEPEKEE